MSAKKIFLCLILIFVISFCIIPQAGAQNVEYVYLGGMPIGIVLDSPGLQICGKTEVITASGAVIPSLEIDIVPGDFLVSIEGKSIKNLEDLSAALDDYKEGVSLELGILRGEKTYRYQISPAKEAVSGKFKIGLIVQDGLSGIGTVTYVRKDGKFGALGHSISSTNAMLESGKVFNCKIIGVKRPRSGEAGELKGIFNKSGSALGKIKKNNNFGVFGQISAISNASAEVRLGCRSQVKEGKAYIYTCVNGNSPQKYEIEILKAYEQNKPKTKSMVIKVTDEKLMREAGGILQGMSGSPIVQGGYLIGAVTHVFTGDSTKGYGLYVDWMINN